MAVKKKENTKNYPALGRWLMFVEKPGAVDRIVYGLYGLCAFLVLIDFTYYKKVYFTMERFPAFYALYGFFMCAALVIASKMMRLFLMRDENYYAPKDTQGEAHPDHDLSKEQVDG